ncbi:hypothetical protein, partial [Thioalkalivibrio sp. HK1]|uniref:hypothetical protein n=1 Tax=Thioalkalivibrio sp. HK1 TaxID=1469245 RepID=UPI001E4510CE
VNSVGTGTLGTCVDCTFESLTSWIAALIFMHSLVVTLFLTVMPKANTHRFQQASESMVHFSE